MNNIVSVLMGTGNKVYLNYRVAEGQTLKLIRMAFMKNREDSNLYWAGKYEKIIMQIHFALHISIKQFFFVYFFFFFFFLLLLLLLLVLL